MLISENLRSVLSKKGWSVKELAYHSKVNQRTIEKWLSQEHTEPKVIAFAAVADALEVSVEYLVYGKDAVGDDELTIDEQDWLDIYLATPQSGRYFLFEQARMSSKREIEREAEIKALEKDAAATASGGSEQKAS